MLLRLAYLGITNAFTLLRLLPGSDRDKDAEILALRHNSRYCTANSTDSGSGSTPPTGHGWPRFCTNSPAPACTAYACWCDPTQSCAGTATCSHGATQQP